MSGGFTCCDDIVMGLDTFADVGGVGGLSGGVVDLGGVSVLRSSHLQLSFKLWQDLQQSQSSVDFRQL